MESFGHKMIVSSQPVPLTGTRVLYPRVRDFFSSFFIIFFLFISFYSSYLLLLGRQTNRHSSLQNYETYFMCAQVSSQNQTENSYCLSYRKYTYIIFLIYFLFLKQRRPTPNMTVCCPLSLVIIYSSWI